MKIIFSVAFLTVFCHFHSAAFSIPMILRFSINRATFSVADTKDKLKKSLVLGYAKNGKGYIHNNIASAVWHHHFAGGNLWITTLGHSKESYEDPVYKHQLLQGIRFIANEYKGLDYTKVRATTMDDPIGN